MRSLVRIGLALMIVAGGVTGCDKFHDDDVAIEGETLVAKDGGCVVQGTVRNEAGERVRVFQLWRALDDRRREIGTAEAESRDLRDHETRSFESDRFREFDGDRISCTEIDRIRRSEFVTDD